VIRHIVLFRLKPGFSWESPEVREAEALQERMGDEIEELREWHCGRNVSDRSVAYDYAVIGLLDDEEAVARYLAHPFHHKAASSWTPISDRVIADIKEDPPRRATAPSPQHPEGE
jgi:hypothetical protein